MAAKAAVPSASRKSISIVACVFVGLVLVGYSVKGSGRKDRVADVSGTVAAAVPPIAVVAPAAAAAVAAGGDGGGNPTATFDTTMGTFTAEIFLNRVPRTASNFIDLVNSGFYTGLHFHRVIDGFMDQFGCPYSKDPHSGRSGTGGPPDGTFKNLLTGVTETRSHGGNIQDENIDRTSNAPGTMSMANTGRPNSGGSQFFLNVADNARLDWFSGGRSKHPVFAKITSGYDVVVAISKVRTKGSAPIVPIKMKSITITM